MEKTAKIILAAGLAAALSVGSFAAGSLITISVDPTVKIKVNGEEFKPKDANGNDVMTFIYNGTTYAPLRALAEAYGLQVGYDAGANMATVDDPDAGYAPVYDNYGIYDDYSASTNNQLYSDDYITLTYSRVYQKDSIWGDEYHVEFMVENKTGSQLNFYCDAISLNGFSYKISGYNNSVAPNSSGYIDFYTDDNSALPLTGITAVSGKIDVYDDTETLRFNDSDYIYYTYDVQFSGTVN